MVNKWIVNVREEQDTFTIILQWVSMLTLQNKHNSRVLDWIDYHRLSWTIMDYHEIEIVDKS